MRKVFVLALALALFAALPSDLPIRHVSAQIPGGIPFNCVVTVSTATTIQAVGGDCAATNGIIHYITGINFSTNAAGIAADSFNTLKYGTGGTCGTGTTVFWGAFTAAATQAKSGQEFTWPIKIPTSNEICWINSTAGSKFLTITGYLSSVN